VIAADLEGDLLMLVQLALMPVCWWAGKRLGGWLHTLMERWSGRTAGQANREDRDRPFPFRR
jgi:hypothetical protein